MIFYYCSTSPLDFDTIVLYMKVSGKFVIRMNPQMHAQLKKEAYNQNISLNEMVNLKLLKANPDRYKSIKKEFKDSLIGIVLFGSTVRGDFRSSSDIDLLIVLDNSQPIQRSLYSRWDEKIEPELGSKYSPQFSHLTDLNNISSLWLEVGLEGEIIFDPSKKIRRTISQIKNKIASGQYIRKVTHGHPYWIRTGVDNE